MARRKNTLPNDQPPLIDTEPENSKEILKVARQYQAAKTQRLEFLEEEVQKKQQLLALIHEAGLKPMDDGKIKFKCDGFVITVQPRDELIKVRQEGDEE